MKKLLTGALALIFSIAASATTLNPVQLLNPAGSSSGQTIVSTGASSAPGWANMTVAHVTGAAALTGATFTGDITVSEPSAALIMNDTSGSGFPQFVYRSNGTNEWIVFDAPSTHTFTVNRYVGGAFQDMPLTVSNSTGIVTMTDGITASPITASPISGSTGSFTTLAASSTVSGAGFTTLLSPYALLASPTFTGTVTTAALTATGAITPSQTAGIVGTTTNNNANAGSVGETITATASSVAQTSATLTNVTSVSLTAGQWDVTCSWTGSTSSGTTSLNFGLTTTSGAQAPAGQRVILGGISTTAGVEMTCPSFPLKLASTTTLYLTSAPAFAGSMTVGGTIWAVRRR